MSSQYGAMTGVLMGKRCGEYEVNLVPKLINPLLLICIMKYTGINHLKIPMQGDILTYASV